MGRIPFKQCIIRPFLSATLSNNRLGLIRLLCGRIHAFSPCILRCWDWLAVLVGLRRVGALPLCNLGSHVRIVISATRAHICTRTYSCTRTGRRERVLDTRRCLVRLGLVWLCLVRLRLRVRIALRLLMSTVLLMLLRIRICRRRVAHPRCRRAAGIRLIRRAIVRGCSRCCRGGWIAGDGSSRRVRIRVRRRCGRLAGRVEARSEPGPRVAGGRSRGKVCAWRWRM